MKENIAEMIAVNDGSLTRRSLLDWLGKATVLALGADLLAACGNDGQHSGGAEPGGGEGSLCEPEDVFLFEPGDTTVEGLLFNGIDPQNLTKILQEWELSVGGLVENPLVFSFAELLQMDRVDQITDFHCVERWSVLDVPWTGVHLSTLFEQARPLPEATHVTFHCFSDVYKESLPLAEALEPKTLLAYGVQCATLPLEHGFPLRLVIPRKWGYKNAKHVYRIELTDEPVLGPWERFGHLYEGDVDPERLREGKY